MLERLYLRCRGNGRSQTVFYPSRGGKRKYERHGPIRASDKICCLLLKIVFIFIFSAQISFGVYLILTLFSLKMLYYASVPIISGLASGPRFPHL